MYPFINVVVNERGREWFVNVMDRSSIGHTRFSRISLLHSVYPPLALSIPSPISQGGYTIQSRYRLTSEKPPSTSLAASA